MIELGEMQSLPRKWLTLEPVLRSVSCWKCLQTAIFTHGPIGMNLVAEWIPK